MWAKPEDKDKPVKVLEALERYCNPRDNEVIESHRFWNVPSQDPFDKFLTELKTKAVSSQEKDTGKRNTAIKEHNHI